MLKHILIVLCFVSIQTLAAAAKDDSSALEKAALEEAIGEVIKEEGIPEDTLESKPSDVNNKGDQAQTQRRKRYFEFGFDAGLSSFSSAIPNYSSYVKRDNSQNVGVYSTGTLNNDALNLIYKRLQDIATSARRQYLPPDPPRPVIPIPTFVPFHIYIPQVGCGCDSTSEIPSSKPTYTPTRPTQPTPTSDFVDNPPATFTPELPTRMGETDNDSRNGNPNSQSDEDDGARPISFVPIGPKRPLNRPVPPVEHGSVQAGAQPVGDTFRGENQQPLSTPTPPLQDSIDALATPSVCEGAILRCCLQFSDSIKSPQANQCFILEGCSDPSANEDPCNPQSLLSIVNKFREFYKRKAGY